MSTVDSVLSEMDQLIQSHQSEVDRLLQARNLLANGAVANISPAAPAAPSSTPQRQGRRGRPPGGGNTRQAQALELVTRQPGITIPKLAETMKIEPNYLYRVMPKLIEQGKVRREDQGWFPTGA